MGPQSEAQLRIIAELAERLGQTAGLRTVLQTLADVLCARPQVRGCEFRLLTGEPPRLETAARAGFDEGAPDLDDDLQARALAHRETAVRATAHAGATIAVPIAVGSSVLGVIALRMTAAQDACAPALRDFLAAAAALAAARVHGQQAARRLRRARRALSRSESVIRDMIDTSPVVLYVLDYRRRVMLQGMERFAAFLGYSPDQIEKLPQGVYSLIHEEDRPGVSQQEARLATARAGTVVPVEFRLRTASGAYRWCLVSSRILDRDAEGRPLTELGSVVDISEMKAAQDAVTKREKHLRSLFENCFDCTVLYERDGTCIYSTPSIERFTGYTDDEIAGQKAIDFVVEEHRFRAVRAWLRLLGKPGGHAVIEQRVLHKDGHQIWIEARLTNSLEDPDVRGVVSNFHDISERKRAEARINQLANYDALTGLPNRRLLLQRLKAAIRKATEQESSFVLLYLDMDRFKNVNDTLGHEVGDHLLMEVAAEIRQASGAEALVARLGGDEFAILLEGVELEAARHVATQLVVRLQRPFSSNGYEVRLTASVGLARFPHHGTNVDELLKHADIAMYRAKAERNRYAVFQRVDARAMAQRVRLENDLQQAVRNRELELWFQPRVALATGAVVGVEALLRWHHPRRGMVSPGDFIPLAEETGLIYRIGEWVLAEACAQASALRARGLELAVSVNLSAQELMRGDIVEHVARTLDEHRLPGAAIELELTETAAMTDLDVSLDTLRRLKDLGVHLAIDDFGTGHSSLSYLRRMPADSLKIDQVFVPKSNAVDDPRERSLIAGIVLLAKSCGLKAVCEGVTAQSQHRLMLELGCDEAQGYYYGHPQAMEQLLPRLERRSAR